MPAPCATCPFSGGQHHLRPEAQAEYVWKVVTYKSQHLCHTADNKKLCRGARTLMLKVMVAQGILTEATDEAFLAKRKELLGF